jgi:hypothetical protein
VKQILAVIALCSLFLSGCRDAEKEEALQKQLTQTETDRSSYQQLLAERDKYLEDVMKEINLVYADLEKERIKEGQLVRRAQGAEGATQVSNLDTRQKLLESIKDVSLALKDNRKRIGDLQTSLKNYRGEVASLTQLVENLKNTIQEREQSIAQLEASVRGLEATLAEKIVLVAQKESQIENQQHAMNTVYYVAAPRKELKEKGIIKDEGGFLWGLLGSTTVMASGVEANTFTRLDRTRDQTIHIAGKIAEILPHRNQDFFATADAGPDASDLTILRPDKFWQDHYLVVVLD